MRHELGRGVLTWARGERVTDRYGTVHLMPEGSNSLSEISGAQIDLVRLPVGVRPMKGRLLVEVTATRESTHIGDFFRGLFPETPEVGEEIVFGEGTLFYERRDFADQVGLIPDEERDIDWLDPEKLYRAHEQSVILYFEEAENV